MRTTNQLFEALDVDGDGGLCRADLHSAAQRLGWGWQEARLYAVLDLLTTSRALSREVFSRRLAQMMDDPLGPFGEVLRQVAPAPSRPASNEATPLLLIDPQRSFTAGAWKQSIGPHGSVEVEPIEAAFASCANLLREHRSRIELMLTRCPFPPDSYDWDDGVRGLIEPSQLYFVKPGNSVLWPPTNGFREWVQDLLARGKRELVIGGCTLNSCVRVSAIKVKRLFGDEGLEVVVDLSLCGARASNHQPSQEFGGLSSVQLAISEMRSAGVQVLEHGVWD